jgi:hypothetical protein
MDTFYLVDYENVGSSGLTKCNALEKTDHLHIFYTENQKKIDLDIVDNHGKAEFETHKVPTKNQSVDMHIVSYMGYLLGKYEGKEIIIVIVSKDKDYDNLIKFWDDKAQLSRKQKIEPPAKKKEQPEKKTEPKKAEAKATKPQPKQTKSEIKTQLNSEIQKLLAKKKYDKSVINNVAKIVGKHYGTENFKRDVHNELGKHYTDFDEIYKDIKTILVKYDG